MDKIHRDTLLSDHLKIHVIDVTTLVIEVVIVIQNSILTEPYHVQGTVNFITNEVAPDLLSLFFS